MDANRWCLVVVLVAGGVACGTADPDGLDGRGRSLASDPIVGVRIDPPSASSSVVLGDTPPTIVFRAFATHASGLDEEITDRATWAVDRTAIGAAAPGGGVALAGIGGHASVTATLDGTSGAAPLVVRLTGEVFGDGTSAASRAAFDAPADPTPIAIEYPLDGTIIPPNLPPFEIQWAGQGPLHRVHVTSDDVLDLTLYTTAPQIIVPLGAWSKMGASAPDEPIAIAVESIDASSHRHASAARTFTITAEPIDQGIIFTHNAAGGIHAIDFLHATELPQLPLNGAQTESCGGCHVVSRNGRRMSYALNKPNMALGAARYDDKRKVFIETISPSVMMYSPSATFNPAEDGTRPSMIATVVAPAPSTLSTLALFDPDTGVALESDIATMLKSVPTWIGTGATMPTWSMAGDLMVFSAYDHADPTDPRPGINVVASSIVEAPVTFGNGLFHFGSPNVLVQATTTDSVFRPSISVDGTAVAYTRMVMNADATRTYSTEIVRRGDRHVFTLAGGRPSEAGSTSFTRTPDWGPTGSKYAWVVVSSSRGYGHYFSDAKKNEQLWIMAVDRAKLAAGDVDPSSPPFWVPGQNTDLMYAHPQWPIAVPAISP